MSMILFLLLIISFPLSILIVGLIWQKILKRSQQLKVLRYQKKMVLYLIPEEKPFSEWRYPIMFLGASGLVFILIVTGFGISINSQTGETQFEMDWSKYIDEETGLYDPWVYSPFHAWTSRNREVILIWFMICYYAGVIATIYFFFEYCKWKHKFVNEYIEVKKKKGY